MERRTHAAKKVVKWSAADGCYVGLCPSLFYGGVHGMKKESVQRALDRVVASWLREESRAKEKAGRRKRQYAKR